MTRERISLFEAERRFANAKGTIVLPPNVEVTGDAALCYSDALSALTLAQAERDTARQERDELRALLQAVWDDVSSIDTDACLSPEVGRRVKAAQENKHV